jgi:hypothetical protein
MLPIALHHNDLEPMYEKWLQKEHSKWWTLSERYNILEQLAEFRRYILARRRLVVMLASQAAISAASTGGGCQDDSRSLRKPMASHHSTRQGHLRRPLCPPASDHRGN